MGLEAKRPEEDSNMRAPLCQMCKNRQVHALNRQQPEKPTLTCAKIGRIPRELVLAKTYNCEYFTLDDDKYEMYIDILSSGLDFDIE